MTFNFTVKEFLLGNGTGTPTLQFYKKGFNLGGSVSPTWQDVILKGATALTLVNAKADSLEYLKLFGGTELLPETYLDTVTLSGGCEQRNLPSGFTQVEYLGLDGNQYIDAGFLANTTKTTFHTGITPTNVGNDSMAVFGSRNATTAGVGSCNIFIMSNGRIRLDWAYSSSTEESTGLTQGSYYDIVCSRPTITINGTDYTADDAVSVDQYQTFLIGNFHNPDGTSFSRGFIGYVHFGKLYNNGSLVFNGIPCRRNSDNVLGMYDTVTNTFLTNAGTGSFTAGADVVVPSPTNPIDIVCNNGAIKVSPNLFDSATKIDGYYISPEGVITANENNCYSALIPVKPNTTYVFSGTNGINTSNNKRLHAYNSNGNWLAQLNFVNINTQGVSYSVIGTTTAQTAYVRISFAIADTNVQLELGSTATPYTPYFPNGIYTQGTQEVVTDSLGNTANAERLLAVGDYKDTQEVLTGTVSRNVGIKVLDGTENWIKGNVSFALQDVLTDFDTSNSWAPICTHGTGILGSVTPVANSNQVRCSLVGTTYTLNLSPNFTTYPDATAWKQFLASQYANGTPVIIVYPTSSATTESVSGQFLSKSPVEQTSGSISNLPIAITESQKTVPTPTQPLDINCNNGVVKVSPNLWNASTVAYTEGSLSATTGQPSASSISHYTSAIPVKPNTTYTLSFADDATEDIVVRQTIKRLHGYATTNIESWVEQLTYVQLEVNGDPVIMTFTTPATVNYIRLSCGLGDYDFQLEYGSTATPYMPYGSTYTDGTTETVEITGKNLFDNSTLYNWFFTSGAVTYNENRYAKYMRISSSETYTISRNDNYDAPLRIVQTETTPEDGVSYVIDGTTTYVQIESNQFPFTFTSRGSAKFLAISVPSDFTEAQAIDLFNKLQVEQGSTATTYEPYFNGGTATAENLFKVGTYQDVQSVIDGGVTRKVVVKVLDGTENWGTFTNYCWNLDESNFTRNPMPVFCSHFEYAATLPTGTARWGKVAASLNGLAFGARTSSASEVSDTIFLNKSDWTQYLASQYNAGTPVIIVYPLETATTETVTAQPMNIQAGTNIVQITQASMDDLELEVKYKAGVAVTITEVQNAQLSNSVTVTIGG